LFFSIQQNSNFFQKKFEGEREQQQQPSMLIPSSLFLFIYDLNSRKTINIYKYFPTRKLNMLFILFFFLCYGQKASFHSFLFDFVNVEVIKKK
jgi:hypothetical protein